MISTVIFYDILMNYISLPAKRPDMSFKICHQAAEFLGEKN